MSQEIWIAYALLFLASHLCLVDDYDNNKPVQRHHLARSALKRRSAAMASRYRLPPGPARRVHSPFPTHKWTGRLWGQTLCTPGSDGGATAGRLSCATGDCSTAECSTVGTTATLAEFTLNSGGQLDAYLVSLVHGFNLPMSVVPRGGTAGNCTESGCFIDLNENCPRELRLLYGKRTVGCRSACDAFGEPYSCCTAWKYGDGPASGDCKAKSYSKFFGGSCPLGLVAVACSSRDYVVTFCPSRPNSSTMSSNDQLKSEDSTDFYAGVDKKKPNILLKGLGVLLAVLTMLALVVIAVRGLFGRKTGFIDKCDPEQVNLECKVICVNIG